MESPSFSTIFEIVLKVILALVVIGAIIGVSLLITDQFIFSFT